MPSSFRQKIMNVIASMRSEFPGRWKLINHWKNACKFRNIFWYRYLLLRKNMVIWFINGFIVHYHIMPTKNVFFRRKKETIKPMCTCLWTLLLLQTNKSQDHTILLHNSSVLGGKNLTGCFRVRIESFTLHLQIIFRNPAFKEKIEALFSSNHGALVPRWSSDDPLVLEHRKLACNSEGCFL